MACVGRTMGRSTLRACKGSGSEAVGGIMKGRSPCVPPSAPSPSPTSFLQPRRPASYIFRLPGDVASIQPLLPLHSATASSRLVAQLSTKAQDGDGGSDGADNPEDKGQWRQWVEQRLKAKGEGQSVSGDEMDSPSEALFGNTTSSGAFDGSQKHPTDPHPVDLPMDDFELRVLGISSKKDDGEDDDLLRELEEIERSASWRAVGSAEGESEEGGDEDEDEDDEDDDDDEWEDERGQVLSDAALSAIVDYDLDDEQHPYQFRPDRLFFPGQTYDPEDLDLSKKPEELERPPPRYRRRYDNNEVLQRADFRNPRYLSNFIAETSRILPKRRTNLTAKAQRKVIREIKTARAFGLMPFTSMGKSPFRFLRSRLDDEDTNNLRQ